MKRGMPYKVIVRVGAPVCLNHPWLHFDALVLHLAAIRALGPRVYDLPTFTPVDVANMPELAPYRGVVRSRAGLKFASVSFFEPEPQLGSLNYFSRIDDGLPKKRVRLGIGWSRAWQMRWVYVSCERVIFYAFGEPDTAADLLQDLVAVGNDTRVGWGWVRSVQVEEMYEDYSVVRDGRAMRPIPVRFLQSYSEAVPLAWRPPYWHRDSMELCAPPGAEVDFGGPPRRVLRKRFYDGRDVA